MGDVDSVSEMPSARGPLSDDELRLIDAYWRAANYLSVGQIYLLDNPLLREPLRPEHVKPRLLGHWGTTPGLNLDLRAHEPRHPQLGPRRDLRHRPRPRRPRHGRQRLPRGHVQRGLPQHRAGRGGAAQALPPVLLPGRHPQPRGARDAGLDPRGRRARLRPRLTPMAPRSTTPTSLVCCVVGDGEAETGPLAASWHSQQVPEPRHATAPCCPSCTSTATRSPTRPCSRGSPTRSCSALFEGYGYHPHFVEGDDPPAVHQRLAAVLDDVRAGDPRHPARGPRARRGRATRAGR